MLNIPSSVLPWLFGSIAFLLFGLRATANFKRLHSPLSLYFAISGYSAFIAFSLWSIPVIFTANINILLIVNIIGDFFLYVMFVMQVVILHYLILKNKIELKFLLAPAIILALLGWLAHCYGYIVGGVSIQNGTFEYQLPLLANIIQSIFLITVFLVGVFMLVRIKQQSEYRGRFVLLGIGILYILYAIGGSLNVILSGSSNDSPAIILSYIIGFTLFIFVFIAVRVLTPKIINKIWLFQPILYLIF